MGSHPASVATTCSSHPFICLNSLSVAVVLSRRCKEGLSGLTRLYGGQHSISCCVYAKAMSSAYLLVSSPRFCDRFTSKQRGGPGPLDLGRKRCQIPKD